MADGASARGLRDDRNVCQLCGALENLSLCSGCHSTWYCSKDHQREHWKLHKRKCKAKQTQKSTQQEPQSESCGYSHSGTSKEAPCTGNNYYNKTAVNLKGEKSKGSEGVDKTVSSPESDDSRSTTGEAEACQPVNSQIASASAREQSSSQIASASEPPSSSASESSSSQTTASQQSSLSAASREEGKKANPTTSGKKKGKGVKKGSLKNKTGQLPAIAEEGSERYFLDAKVFPQAAQSRHRTQTRHSAKLAMAPEGSTQAMNSKDAYLDVMLSRFDVTAKYVVDCLNTYGICVMDCFLGDVNGQEILYEVKCFKDRGLMRQGQVVHAGATSSGKIRGDIITWVDGREEHCENIRYLVSCMDAVVLKCSSLLENYTINERTKAMVACYPGQATGYVRHVDNPNQDGRCITCIYYLNKDWDVRRDGGMLRIYPEGMDRVADIEPKFDRVLFFWSDRRNPHEVLPANRERYAITVWYYEAEERARALKRFKGDVSAHPKKQAVPLFSKRPSSPQHSANNNLDASR